MARGRARPSGPSFPCTSRKASVSGMSGPSVVAHPNGECLFSESGPGAQQELPPPPSPLRESNRGSGSFTSRFPSASRAKLAAAKSAMAIDLQLKFVRTKFVGDISVRNLEKNEGQMYKISWIHEKIFEILSKKWKCFVKILKNENNFVQYVHDFFHTNLLTARNQLALIGLILHPPPEGCRLTTGVEQGTMMTSGG